MKDRNLINSFCEKIKSSVSGWNRKTIQRVSYTAIFVVIVAVVATSYMTADSSTQVSLPGVAGASDIDVNLLQGQKIEQIDQANALAASISSNTGGSIASGAGTAAPATTATTADEVKAANVASSVAEMANLSSSDSVSSSAESANISAELAQADATSVNKQQQILETSDESTSVLISYVAQAGDNADTLATKYGVSAQTIRWANGLKDSNIAPGATITIPAVDGVVYTVKDGDNLAAIAGKYGSDVDDIITLNNLNDDQVASGTRLLLPDGILPETERPEYVAPTPVRQTTTGGSTRATISNLRVPSAGGNRYAYGYCTWYAYNRRVQLGLPVASGWGNANTWDYYARLSGYQVDTVPSVGAIFQTKSGYYGHVGIVERVNPDGTIYVSEMNYSGWNVISHRTITNLSGYRFIH